MGAASQGSFSSVDGGGNSSYEDEDEQMLEMDPANALPNICVDEIVDLPCLIPFHENTWLDETNILPKMRRSRSVIRMGSSVNSSIADASHCEICSAKFSKLALRFMYQCSDCGKLICSKCHVKSYECNDWSRKCKVCLSGQIPEGAGNQDEFYTHPKWVPHTPLDQDIPVEGAVAPDALIRSPMAAKPSAVARYTGDDHGSFGEQVKTVTGNPQAIEQAKEAVRTHDEKHLRKLLMKGLKHDPEWKDFYLKYCLEKGVHTRDIKCHTMEFIAQFFEIHMAQSITKQWARKIICKLAKKDQEKEKKQPDKKEKKVRIMSKEGNEPSAGSEADKAELPVETLAPAQEKKKDQGAGLQSKSGERLGKAFPDASPKLGCTKKQPASKLEAHEEKIKGGLADTTARKKAAIARENYSEANELKGRDVDFVIQLGGFKELETEWNVADEKLKTISEQLVDLGNKKKAAIAEENFVEAQQLKVAEADMTKKVEAIKEEKSAIEKKNPPRGPEPADSKDQMSNSTAEPKEEMYSEAENDSKLPSELYELRKAQLEKELGTVRAAKDEAVTAEDFGRAQLMKSRADELWQKWFFLDIVETARVRIREEIQEAEDERRKAEEAKNARIQRRQALQAELDKVIAGKRQAIVEEDFAAAQIFKAREKEIQAELQTIKDVEGMSLGSEQQIWSESQSVMLCPASQWHKDDEKAWHVDNFETTSLSDALDHFNRGTKTCKAAWKLLCAL